MFKDPVQKEDIIHNTVRQYRHMVSSHTKAGIKNIKKNLKNHWSICLPFVMAFDMFRFLRAFSKHCNNLKISAPGFLKKINKIVKETKKEFLMLTKPMSNKNARPKYTIEYAIKTLFDDMTSNDSIDVINGKNTYKI